MGVALGEKLSHSDRVDTILHIADQCSRRNNSDTPNDVSRHRIFAVSCEEAPLSEDPRACWGTVVCIIR